MSKTKDTIKQGKIDALDDKLANLRYKQSKCIVPEGIARYSRMIHEVERDLAVLLKKEAA